MDLVSHISAGVLPAEETETTLQNNVKYYL